MSVLFVYMIATVIVGIGVQKTRAENLKKFYLFSVFFFAFLYAGLRGKTVGLDTALWNSIFDNIAQNGLAELPRNTEVEKGYMLLNLLLYKLGLPSQSIVLVMSAFISYSFYKIIVQYSKNYVLSALIFISTIFTVTMNVSRQYFALAFVLFSFSAIVEKNPKKAILFIIIASLIHYSAIIMLPLVLFAIPKVNITKKVFFAISAASFLMIPLYMVIVSAFVSVFNQYERFITSSHYSGELEISSQYVILFVMVAILGLLYIKPFKIIGSKIVIARKSKNIDKEKIKDPELQNYLLFFLLFIEYIVVYFISRKLMIAARFIYYFQSSLVIMIPNSIFYLKRRYKSKFFAGVISFVFIVYFIYFGFRYFVADPHGILPYSFFWE